MSATAQRARILILKITKGNNNKEKVVYLN